MSQRTIGWVLLILGVVGVLIGLSYFFFIDYLLNPKGASDEGEKPGWAFTLLGILGLVLGWLALRKTK